MLFNPPEAHLRRGLPLGAPRDVHLTCRCASLVPLARRLLSGSRVEADELLARLGNAQTERLESESLESEPLETQKSARRCTRRDHDGVENSELGL